MRFLWKKAKDNFGDDVIVFTVDGNHEWNLRCGTLEGPYTTIDFGPCCKLVALLIASTVDAFKHCLMLFFL